MLGGDERVITVRGGGVCLVDLSRPSNRIRTIRPVVGEERGWWWRDCQNQRIKEDCPKDTVFWTWNWVFRQWWVLFTKQVSCPQEAVPPLTWSVRPTTPVLCTTQGAGCRWECVTRTGSRPRGYFPWSLLGVSNPRRSSDVSRCT